MPFAEQSSSSFTRAARGCNFRGQLPRLMPRTAPGPRDAIPLMRRAKCLEARSERCRRRSRCRKTGIQENGPFLGAAHRTGFELATVCLCIHSSSHRSLDPFELPPPPPNRGAWFWKGLSRCQAQTRHLGVSCVGNPQNGLYSFWFPLKQGTPKKDTPTLPPGHWPIRPTRLSLAFWLLWLGCARPSGGKSKAARRKG